MRLFELAKELNLASKDLVAFAQELGFAGIKNQLNTLEPEQVDALKDRAKKGPKPGTAHAPPMPTKPVIPPAAKIGENRVQTLPKSPIRPVAATKAPPAGDSGVVAQPGPVQPHSHAAASAPAPEVLRPAPEPEPVEPKPIVAEARPTEPAPEPVAEPAVVHEPATPPAPPQNIIPTLAAGGLRNLGGGVRNLN
ncbi:MAG TPA: translation initiation factor IF-2 N-terminal domain-containing protein, partial [Gemmataceae bacterium]|nr:translation initiation factor IF-2 N-terminal domain-containing protein [Gemmataceae bacterium]